ncbi:MAG: PQQ-binding-like beta-propeller repeat protein [Halieaceae bacterium]|nr:PQQ-binding-like beta-propeller repeat protein [Halieaceae bacterium]
MTLILIYRVIVELCRQSSTAKELSGTVTLILQTVLLLLTFVLLPASAYGDDSFATRYAKTPWPAGHRDAGNTDYVPLLSSHKNQIGKHLLRGHPVFWAPTAGPNGNFYVSSGRGQGSSNLHAFDNSGNLLWKSRPQSSLDDLDGWAIINAPIIAANGDVYVGDQNQLWSFKPSGKVKWKTDLTQYGTHYGFMTAIISHQGYVGGISTNGKVIFLNPDNGALAMPVLDLPGGRGPAAQDSPPADLWRNLMDPAIKPVMFNLIQGWEMEVANTPAIHPQTGRVYITAYGVVPDTGLLYGIDVHDDHMEIAFQTPMGKGSGTSPAISHDGKQVYALDELGHMLAIDAYSGHQIWRSSEQGGGAASPTVGPDETIYTPFQDHLLGFNYDGSMKFSKSYNQYCADRIKSPDWLWSLVLSEPVAFLNSLFTADANSAGWLNIVCGYHIKLQPSKTERTLVPIPVSSTIAAVNLETGEPLNSAIIIPETSEGFIVPTMNGNLFVTLSGAISSIFYNMLNPFLPRRFEVPHEPHGGVLLLEPESRKELAIANIEWLQKQQYRAKSQLNRQFLEEVERTLANCAYVLQSSMVIIDKASEENQVTTRAATAANRHLRQLQSLLAGSHSPLADTLAEMERLLQAAKIQVGTP